MGVTRAPSFDVLSNIECTNIVGFDLDQMRVGISKWVSYATEHRILRSPLIGFSQLGHDESGAARAGHLPLCAG